MKACRALIPAAEAIAHEADSHELGRLLDDAAAVVWRTCGEESPLGRLADEARWAAFVLHDRIALHAVGEAGVSERELAIQALTPIDSVFRSPSRLLAELEELTVAVSRCGGAVAGMAAGYTRVCARSHPLMAALRHAANAIEALRAALDEAVAAARPPSGRLHASARRAVSARGTLLLLRDTSRAG